MDMVPRINTECTLINTKIMKKIESIPFQPNVNQQAMAMLGSPTILLVSEFVVSRSLFTTRC